MLTLNCLVADTWVSNKPVCSISTFAIIIAELDDELSDEDDEGAALIEEDVALVDESATLSDDEDELAIALASAEELPLLFEVLPPPPQPKSPTAKAVIKQR